MNVISGGDAAFSAVTSPNIFASAAPMDNFMDKLSDAGRNIYNTASTFAEDSKKLLSNMKHTLENLGDSGRYVHPDMIYHINTLQGIRDANYGMQRWLMSHEGLKSEWLNGLDTFEGYNPIANAHGVNDYDWRRVNEGVISVEGNNIVSREFLEYIHNPTNDVLSIEDKHQILRAHKYLDRLMEEGVEIFECDDNVEYF